MVPCGVLPDTPSIVMAHVELIAFGSTIRCLVLSPIAKDLENFVAFSSWFFACPFQNLSCFLYIYLHGLRHAKTVHFSMFLARQNSLVLENQGHRQQKRKLSGQRSIH